MQFSAFLTLTCLLLSSLEVISYPDNDTKPSSSTTSLGTTLGGSSTSKLTDQTIPSEDPSNSNDRTPDQTTSTRRVLEVSVKFKQMTSHAEKVSSSSEETSTSLPNKIRFFFPPRFAEHKVPLLTKRPWLLIFTSNASFAYGLRVPKDQTEIYENCEIVKNEDKESFEFNCDHNPTTDRFSLCFLDEEKDKFNEFMNAEESLNPEWTQMREIITKEFDSDFSQTQLDELFVSKATGNIPALKKLDFLSTHFTTTIMVQPNNNGQTKNKFGFTDALKETLDSKDDPVSQFFARRMEWCKSKRFCRTLLRGMNKLMGIYSKENYDELSYLGLLVKVTTHSRTWNHHGFTKTETICDCQCPTTFTAYAMLEEEIIHHNILYIEAYVAACPVTEITLSILDEKQKIEIKTFSTKYEIRLIEPIDEQAKIVCLKGVRTYQGSLETLCQPLTEYKRTTKDTAHILEAHTGFWKHLAVNFWILDEKNNKIMKGCLMYSDDNSHLIVEEHRTSPLGNDDNPSTIEYVVKAEFAPNRTLPALARFYFPGVKKNLPFKTNDREASYRLPKLSKHLNFHLYNFMADPYEDSYLKDIDWTKISINAKNSNDSESIDRYQYRILFKAYKPIQIKCQLRISQISNDSNQSISENVIPVMQLTPNTALFVYDTRIQLSFPLKNCRLIVADHFEDVKNPHYKTVVIAMDGKVYSEVTIEYEPMLSEKVQGKKKEE